MIITWSSQMAAAVAPPEGFNQGTETRTTVQSRDNYSWAPITQYLEGSDTNPKYLEKRQAPSVGKWDTKSDGSSKWAGNSALNYNQLFIISTNQFLLIIKHISFNNKNN